MISSRRFNSIPLAVIAASLVWTTGCVCGRVGGVYLLDNAIAVEDANADCQCTALVQDDQVTRVRGVLVPTMTASHWLVADETVRTTHMLRTSKLRPEQRLPVWVNDHRLRLIDLEASATWAKPPIVPNPLDTDDEEIRSLRLNQDRLMAVVAPRFNVRDPSANVRYVVFPLPDGPWQALPAKQGAQLFPHYARVAKFADLRSGAVESAPSGPTTQPRRKGWGAVTSFQELESRSMSRGDWGELSERETLGMHETLFKSPDGKELVILR